MKTQNLVAALRGRPFLMAAQGCRSPNFLLDAQGLHRLNSFANPWLSHLLTDFFPDAYLQISPTGRQF
ncbi:MAG: hypothetical protein WAL85_15560 [Candidatus Korobacteraceae bacterium]